MSLTVTVKLQVPELPDASVALHTTVVTPTETVDPGAGPDWRDMEAAQLSLTVGGR